MRDDAAVLLLRAGKKSRNVFEGDERNVEAVAEAHKARSLDARFDVEHARQKRGLVGDDAHRLANDVWIFQVAGTLTQANATRVTLKGGALPKNIFWQISGAVAIGTTAHFEGVMLAKTRIAMKTSASANGRLLAQTAVTLQENSVTQPAR